MAVWVPPRPEKRAHVSTYVFECYYPKDLTRFLELLEDRGAYFLSAQRAPFWNVYQQIIGRKYVILYQNTEELSMEVMT